MEEIRSLELHLHQLMMNQLICVPSVVVEEALILLDLQEIRDKVVVVAEVVVVNPQVPVEHHHQDFPLADLHIHYHMELLLDMVVTVVLELLDLQTSVMVVAVVVLELMDTRNQMETIPLEVVDLEQHSLLEETPTPSQVVAVEDVGTHIQTQEMLAQVVQVVVLPVV